MEYAILIYLIIGLIISIRPLFEDRKFYKHHILTALIVFLVITFMWPAAVMTSIAYIFTKK